jgi:hypothetical protein
MRAGTYERWLAGAAAENEGEVWFDGSPSSIILQRGGWEEEREREREEKKRRSEFV